MSSCHIKPLKKHTRVNSLGIDPLDERRKHPGLGIRAPRGDQDVVRVPIDGQDRGPQRFLEVLGDPPIVLLVKGTDGDRPRSAAHGELVLVRAPLDTGRRAVDSEENEGGFPGAGFVLGPDVGVTVLRAGHDTVRSGSPGDGGDELVVLRYQN